MPSRKQRRRRAKDRRHEYEYVYVDDEGQEVEVGPEERKGETRPRRKDNQVKTRGRPVREVKPPSWNRSLRRALMFLPLFFVVFSIVNKKLSIEYRALSSLAYSALFVPLTYLMDRTAHRSFLRRTGRSS
jgi:hypothetical protein